MATDTATKAAKPAMKTAATSTVRLRSDYMTKFVPELEKELGLKNLHQVPKLEKIVVNIGLGRAKDDKKIIETATNTLTKITGQDPVETFAKKSIAGFKLREGNMIGLKVTLRGDKMYEFADRLINIVLPRLRDFHGVSNKAFDKAATTASVSLTNRFSQNYHSKKLPPSTACKSYS